jgi:DNA replication protein DnaC
MPDQYDFMAPVINNARKNAVVNPEDFKDSDGLLVCGKCGKRKQKLITLTRNGAEVPMVVPVMCKCKSDAYKQQKARDEQEKEMEAISKLRKDSLMDSRFRSISFKNFVLNQYNEKCFRLCKRYATAFDKMMEKNMGLLMYGGVGTGKTFAAACIANYLLDQKIPVVMISFIKLLEMLEKNTDNDIIQNLQSAKLLVLDDLGAERRTSYALEKVYNIIDARYRSKLPVILTTNLTMDEMMDAESMQYERIYDRIFEMCYPLEFKGMSWRKKAAFAKSNEMEKFLNG